MVEVVDIRAARDHALSQRMRDARASGRAPLWPLPLPTSGDPDAPPDEVPMRREPGDDDDDDEAGMVVAGVDGSSAPPGTVASQLTLTVAVLAVLGAVVVGVLMMRHKSRYEYSE